MTYRHTIAIALHHLRKEKGRAGLTIFGITIGIAMVILVLSAGDGVKGLVLGELDSFGNDWINIEVKVPSTGKASQENATSQARGVTITTLTYDDATAIQSLRNIEELYAGVTTQAVVHRESETLQPTIFAVSDGFVSVDGGSTLAAGRFFTAEEDAGLGQVAVLGHGVKENLFGNSDAVGETIKVGSRSFRVVGVFEERGATGFFNWDDILFLPLQTTQKKLMGIDHILFIIAQMGDPDLSEQTAEEIRWLLRDRHDITDPDKDDFAVTTQQESVELISTVFFGIQTLLVVLAAISLAVGGVGIMNVMYVSVVERTFEIGLRKSVGATERDIRRQFLNEAVILTLIGGGVGIVVGITLSIVAALAAQTIGGLDWPIRISLPSIVIATSFSIAVGVVFGYFPAKQAASLDPIEALRAE